MAEAREYQQQFRVPIIPPGDILPSNPLRWTSTEVKRFIEYNKDEFHLRNDDIEPFARNRVDGPAFLKLTRKRLLENPYNFVDGPACSILELVDELKSWYPPIQTQYGLPLTHESECIPGESQSRGSPLLH